MLSAGSSEVPVSVNAIMRVTLAFSYVTTYEKSVDVTRQLDKRGDVCLDNEIAILGNASKMYMSFFDYFQNPSSSAMEKSIVRALDKKFSSTPDLNGCFDVPLLVLNYTTLSQLPEVTNKSETRQKSHLHNLSTKTLFSK